MEYITLYNKARTGATRVWQIGVEGNQISTKFGQLGGVLQEVTDYGYAKNEGKKNYISAEEDAHNLAERMILLKRREGYGEEQDTQREFHPFGAGLPEHLSFYKPQNSLTAKMLKMVNEGTAWALRKYDGEMMVIVKSLEGEISIYSRKMLMSHHNEDIPWTKRFPHIVEEMQSSTIPPGTILIGEMVYGITHGVGKDNRWVVAQVMKSLTPRALELQKEHGGLGYVVWDVAWWGGEQLLGKVPFNHRFDNIVVFCDKRFIQAPWVAIEGEYEGVEDLRRRATVSGWEGFVVVDPNSTYGDKAFNLRGKPDRPAECCKLKPYFEDDFIAKWNPAAKVGKWGRGKYTGYMGAVQLFQYNEAGELIYICDCGNGFTAEFIENNSDVDLWPMVIQVRYEARTYISDGDDTNALQFPRFIAVREDKGERECVNPLL
jgi:ATP-dependent DNA ligase